MAAGEARARHDVAVVGGGPAGAAAAHLLATWGHSVVVLTKPEPHDPSLAESLPPSCLKLFGAVGIAAAVEAAGFLRSRGNTVWWGSGPPRTESFERGAAGFQVLRRTFDRLMLAEAERAGAEIRRGVTVRAVTLPPTGDTDGCVHVRAEDERGAPVIVDARSALDCTGRAGVLGHRYRERVAAGGSTLALVGVWQRDDDWRLPDESHTLVETYADGWAWSVPTSTRRRYLTVMVDPRTTTWDPGGPLGGVYSAQVRKTTHFTRLTAGARLEGAPWACDASQYGAREFGGTGFLLVGDAATSIDPLSSFGVKKALASAWLAAIVTHTRLRRPEREALALRLYDERERRVFASYRRQAATFFADVSHQNPHPFWSDRADPSDQQRDALDDDDEDQIDRFRHDRDVLDAFDAVKRAASIRLRAADRVRRRVHPAVEGREVVAETRIVIGDGPDASVAVRYLRGVDLPRLVAMAGAHRQVPDLYEAYQRVGPPVALPDFLGALSVLLGKGVLRNDSP